MKRFIIAIAIAFGFGMNVNAQIGQYNRTGNDAFFTTSSYSEYREDVTIDEWGTMPFMPSSHGGLADYSADQHPTPVGSGLLLLASMGLAYGLRKRNK